MDAVAPRGEKDRMRHAGIVPFLRVVHDLHAEGRVGAIRSRKAGSSGRDRPAVKHLPINRDGHGLTRLVDLDEDIGEGGRARGASKECLPTIGKPGRIKVWLSNSPTEK